MTVRLWHFHNDAAVRVTLREGQPVTFSCGGPTEEGYHRESTTLTLEGGVVRQEYASDGRDCDGRVSFYSEAVCPVHQLDRGNEWEGTRYPAWQKVDEFQRDYSAEAMGY